MTRDEVIRLAHLTGVLDEQHYGSVWVDRLFEFANAVLIANASKGIQQDIISQPSADLLGFIASLTPPITTEGPIISYSENPNH